MEIVAMDMKLRGMYIARQLSFKGVSFKIEEVPLSKEFRKIYDQSVELWVEAMQKFTEAAELIDAESRMKKTMWGQFWSSHQRFFKYLCIAAKVNHAVLVARESIKSTSLSKTTCCKNNNQPESLYLPVSYAGGASQIRALKVAGNIGGVGNNQKPPPIATTPGSGGPAGGAPGSGVKGNNSMMEAVQKLIAMNPEYLTSGIPNTVFQMFMQSMQRPQATPSPNQPMNPGAMVTSAAAAAAHASAVAYVQQEEDEVDYEEMGVAETYADYWPAKCKFNLPWIISRKFSD